MATDGRGEDGRGNFKGNGNLKRKEKTTTHTQGKSEGLLIPRLVRAGSSAGAASNSVRLAVQQQGVGRADAAGKRLCVCDGRVWSESKAPLQPILPSSPSSLSTRQTERRDERGRGGAANPCKLSARVFPRFPPCRRCPCVSCV